MSYLLGGCGNAHGICFSNVRAFGGLIKPTFKLFDWIQRHKLVLLKTLNNTNTCLLSTKRRNAEGLTEMRLKKTNPCFTQMCASKQHKITQQEHQNVTVITHPRCKRAPAPASFVTPLQLFSNSHPRLLCSSSSCYSGPWLGGHSLIFGRNSLQMLPKGSQPDLYRVVRRA